MAPLATWGLPTSKTDTLLFGGDKPWPGGRFAAELAAAERRQRAAGADTDLNPVGHSDRLVDLTSDEPARAEILRRYRLYSRQPDEMITFMALQRMDPRRGDLDPRMYQYGGGYIFMIGAVVAIADLVGLVSVSTDIGLYLESPERFARFYLAARFVTLVFGALTLAAVFYLAHRAGGRTAGWLALVCAAACPVFLTGALEAKPHLPATCLVLWAALCADHFLISGRRRDAFRLGALGGGAFSLVLTGLASAILWPGVWLVSRAHGLRAAWQDRRAALRYLAHAAILAVAIYVLTNPYIPYNALFRPQVVGSNFENSLAMYRDRVALYPQGAVRVGELLVESCGVSILIAGLIGFVLLMRRWPARTAVAAAPGIAMLVLCIFLAAGKPAEFARFLLLPVLLMCVAAGWLLRVLYRVRAGLGVAAFVIVLLTTHTPRYVRAFISDAHGVHESRRLAAEFIAAQIPSADPLGVIQEPAPFSIPPLDFTRRDVVLLPASKPADLDPAALPPWLVFTADDERVHAGDWWQPHYQLVERFPDEGTPPARIAWANKPTFLYQRAAAR